MRTHSRRVPHPLRALANFWGHERGFIACALLVFGVLSLTTSAIIWPPHHEDKPVENPAETTISVPTTPAPPYLAASEWLVTYQGRDLHCLALHGDVEGQRMTCDWVRWHAEAGQQ